MTHERGSARALAATSVGALSADARASAAAAGVDCLQSPRNRLGVGFAFICEERERERGSGGTLKELSASSGLNSLQ